MGRFGLALACLILSGCVSTPFERGVTAYREGRYPAAVAAFDEAARLDPGSAAAWSNRGAARTRTGDLAGALLDYDHAITLEPDDSTLYVSRGNALVAAGEPQRAIADYTRAIAIDALNGTAYYNRGTARLLAGDPRGREDRLRAVEVEVDPWKKADMRRRLGLAPAPAEGPSAAPAGAAPVPPSARGPAVTLPSEGAARAGRAAGTGGTADAAPGPGSDAKSKPASVNLDAKALAARGVARELDGDHIGAIADLRAALALEQDDGRRAGIENLLRLLTEPSR